MLLLRTEGIVQIALFTLNACIFLSLTFRPCINKLGEGQKQADSLRTGFWLFRNPAGRHWPVKQPGQRLPPAHSRNSEVSSEGAVILRGMLLVCRKGGVPGARGGEAGFIDPGESSNLRLVLRHLLTATR